MALWKKKLKIIILFIRVYMNYPDFFFQVGEFCDFGTLIILRQTCKNACRGIKITYVPTPYESKLNNDILQRSVHLRTLDCSYQNITDEGIKGLINLQTLYCWGCQNITDEGIKGLINLQKLYCTECQNITDKGIESLRNRGCIVSR